MEYTVQKLLSPYIYNDIADFYSTGKFSCFKNKTVFITGAGELTGYYLACGFLIGNDVDGNNTKVIVSDREESLFEKYGNLTYRRDIEFLVTKDYSNMPREKSDFIIHTDCNGNKEYFEAMTNLLEYAQQSGANTVLCSDMSIYGSVYNGKSTLSEEDNGYIDLADADSYAVQSQRMVESYGKRLVKENNLNIKFARVCAVLGALGSSPLNQLAATANDEFYTVGKGMSFYAADANVTQSYCYVTDIVSALLMILADGKSGEVYNISSNCDTSMKNITEACQKLLPDVNVAYRSKKNNHDNSPMNSTHFVLDNSKLTVLGFTPRVSLDESIKRIVTIIQNNR